MDCDTPQPDLAQHDRVDRAVPAASSLRVVTRQDFPDILSLLAWAFCGLAVTDGPSGLSPSFYVARLPAKDNPAPELALGSLGE